MNNNERVEYEQLKKNFEKTQYPIIIGVDLPIFTIDNLGLIIVDNMNQVLNNIILLDIIRIFFYFLAIFIQLKVLLGVTPWKLL